MTAGNNSHDAKDRFGVPIRYPKQSGGPGGGGGGGDGGPGGGGNNGGGNNGGGNNGGGNNGGGNNGGGNTPIPVPVPVNRPPIQLSLSDRTIRENLPRNRVIGALSAIDPDGGDLNYSIVAGAGGENNAAFEIRDNNKLFARRSFDFEKKRSYKVLVQVSDSNGATLRQSFTIRVQNRPEPPPSRPEDPDRTFDTAVDLGSLDTSLFRRDRTGFPLRRAARNVVDRTDYYSFNVKTPGQLTVRLSQLRADANLELWNGARDLLRTSRRKGRQAESITLDVAAGDFYVKVVPVGKAQTPYVLSLGTIPAPDRGGGGGGDGGGG
ncbi:MAG: cadherin repeat domain-containing protein, partial [Cyanobacteria bacterium CRU_2_1]|nr:cadherin repeat domain-containing protein [Cyanobacteria bacterium CRU_2_1]